MRKGNEITGSAKIFSLRELRSLISPRPKYNRSCVQVSIVCLIGDDEKPFTVLVLLALIEYVTKKERASS